MPAPTPPDFSQLPWQAHGDHQMATDGSCLYMREGSGSMIAGIVLSVVLALAAGGLGGWLLLTQTGMFAKTFGGFMLLVSAVFIYVLWSSTRRGRWMIVYDRGQAATSAGHPSTPAEIRFNGQHLPADRVRSLSTRPAGGSLSMPRHIVVAELHDGTYEALGPSGVSTWPAHYGQLAATWMNLPFRHFTQ